MTTATSRRAPPPAKALAQRRELCGERLDIERRLAGDYARMAEIDATLKKLATEAGASFKEEFPGLGYVSAAGAVAAEFKGDVPMIQTEKWQALTPAERKARMKGGVIVMEPQWSKSSNGRVTVKVYA
jgi:hypothetical protein